MQRKEYAMKKGVFLCALLATAFLLIGLPSVSAPKILITPIDKTIVVVSNETFVLAYKMEWDEPDIWEPPPPILNYFSVTVYWDCNDTTPHLNFTYIDYVCKYTNGTNVPLSGWSLKKKIPSGSTTPRYTLAHQQDDGVGGNGEFWLNVTMRAAGVVNGYYTPHAGGDQKITISSVRCNEETTYEVGPGDATIRVVPVMWSCDSTGSPKEVFNVTLGEAVYVKGIGFGSGVEMRLYVVENTTWTDGQAIGADVRGIAYNFTTVDPFGVLGDPSDPSEPYCLGIPPLGEFDIVADIYPYGRYNNATDAVDDLSSAPGVTVVPEFSYGIAILIMAVLAAVSVAIYTRNRKPYSFI